MGAMNARRILGPAACAAALLSIATPAHADRTYRVDMTATAKLKGTDLVVQLTGSPVGTCKGTARLQGDGATFRARCRDGRISVRIRFAGRDQSRGSWRFTSGTGRFRGAWASGRYTGNLSQLRFRLTGRARF